MNVEKLSWPTPQELRRTISVKDALLDSLKDREFRKEFVGERVRSSMALQIRALRSQRRMSQEDLGNALGMAQTWVSKLENPNYGKMTVATLIRLAGAFDTDLEIKFRPFSKAVSSIANQNESYFVVPSFTDEFSHATLSPDELAKVEKRAVRTQKDAAEDADFLAPLPLWAAIGPPRSLSAMYATR